MANKGGALANIGQALSGYGSALSGNPMFLQNSLIMRQMQDQRRQQEQEQRQNQVGNAAAMSFLRTQGMEGTPATKQFQVNGKTYGQNAPATKMGDPLSMFSKFAGGGTPLQSIAAQRAMNELFPQEMSAAERFRNVDGVGLVDIAAPGGPQTVVSRQEKPKFSPGDTRSFERGDRTITQEYQADGTWANIGEAPRWEPPSEPQKPFGWDEEQARKDEEAERKRRADEYAFQNTDEGFSDIIRLAARLGTNPNLDRYTGKFDAMTPDITEGASDFTANLETLKSNLAMSALQAARAGSASGATGFGALSEKELNIIQTLIAKLDPSVGKERFQAQILEVIRRTKGMQNRLRATRPDDAAPPSTRSALTGFSIRRVE